MWRRVELTKPGRCRRLDRRGLSAIVSPAGSMARVTITISDARLRALDEASARTGNTVGELVEESLDICGIRSGSRAGERVGRAREHAGMSEEAALALAVEETRAARDGSVRR